MCDKDNVISLINQLKHVFKDIDEIIHAGDICEENFLNQIKTIAPVHAVRGNLDKIENLDTFFKISVGRYNIGVIHILPDNLEDFVKRQRAIAEESDYFKSLKKEPSEEDSISPERIDLEQPKDGKNLIRFACGHDKNAPNAKVCKNCGTELN